MYTNVYIDLVYISQEQYQNNRKQKIKCIKMPKRM